MFRTVPLSIIRSFSLYTQQWYMSYRFADSLRAGSGRNWSSVLILVKCPLNVLILTIKPTRCTNFSEFFLDWNSTCFGQFLCPSSGVFHCTHSNGTSRSCSQAVSKPVWHIPLLCVQWKTPDDGRRNFPKHVEFYSKNKFEKLLDLVGFIIIIYHDVQSPERQKPIRIGALQLPSTIVSEFLRVVE